jgi:hypothetical protein
MENIVEKIKKLLALSENNNSPEEAALAASRAQELMVKYAIEQDALQPAQRVVEIIKSYILQTDYNRLPTWHALLAYVLAPSFFCRSFFTRGGKYSKAIIYFVGRESDYTSLVLTYSYLKADIERLCDAAWAKLPAEYSVHGKHWKASFYDGVCNTIRMRLDVNIKRLAADNAGTAIVLANKQKEVDDFVEANHKLRQSGSSRNISQDGYTAGVAAGHALNLGARSSKALPGKVA